MSVNLSNIINGGTLSVSGGGTGITSAGTSGNILTSTGSGWLSSPLPTASNVVLGGVKVDGASITINNGVISASSTATKTISNKTAAYTVVASDLGKIINCTSGTFTVSLTAAATLGSGFTCTIWNQNNSGSLTTITIDPNASETIGSKGTWILRCGEGVDIVCNGTNWDISYERCNGGFSINQEQNGHNPALAVGNGSVAIGWNASTAGVNSIAIKATASSEYSVAIGSGAVMSGGYGIAIGYNASATGGAGVAIGPSTVASASESVAIGRNSSYQGSQATGAGAMALGGSYASGTDSFAAAIVNNTSTYGATGANSVAIGQTAKASSANSVAIGKNTNCSMANCVALGVGAYTESANRLSFNAQDSYYSQTGIIHLSTSTNIANPTSTMDYVIPYWTSSAYTALLVGRDYSSQATAAFKIEGVMVFSGSGSSAPTLLGGTTITTLGKSAGASEWDVTVTAVVANTVRFTVTGSATGVRWTLRIDCADVKYW